MATSTTQTTATSSPSATESQGDTLILALAGQPNVGKSTVFNMLTGLNQHVGNWPGKTVEQKIGHLEYQGQRWTVVDLPGTYSLTANSEEERIAREYILREKPDVVAVVVSAASLEHGLYLLAEVLGLGRPVVLALNMMDVAEQNGIRVEPHVLAAALGVPVVPMVASKGQGVRELLDVAREVVAHPEMVKPVLPELSPEHRPVWQAIREALPPTLAAEYPLDWLATKLLEGDTELTELVRQRAPEAWEKIHPLLMQHEDAFLDVASARYAWVERMIRAAVASPRIGALTLTDRLDRVATHPFWGLVVLLVMSGGMYWLVYTLAFPIVDWLAAGVDQLAVVLAGALAGSPTWLQGLVVDGLVGGVGAVISFVPILAVFFAALAFLEDVGYMARAAYVVDRFMHWMGLHGRSFLPLFLGFGCNVPAVMGARIVESRRARLLTILLAPLVPCTARMAVVTFLAPAFFGRWAALVVWGLVALNMLVLMVLGVAINRLFYHGERTAFIMEMPLYHRPNLRNILLPVWQHTWEFLRRAATMIVLISMVVWALSYFPSGDPETSWLAAMGRALDWLGHSLGWPDWRLMTALLSSFLAKENTIATLGVLYGVGGGGLAQRVAQPLSPAGALSFLVVQMLFIPCAATLATIRKEAGTRWALYSVGLLLVVSFLAGWGVYLLAHGLGW